MASLPKSAVDVLPKTAAEAIRLIAKVTFRPFDDEDFSAYQGADTGSGEAWIHEGEDMVIILVDDTVSFYEYGVSESAFFVLTLR